MSRPSSHAIGASETFWCPWKCHPGVSSRSPRRMATGSPSTTVHAPSPSRTNRNADWVCRCSGAFSRGARYWMAAHSVGVAYGSPGRPGFPSPMARRSPPRPTGTSSALRAARGTVPPTATGAVPRGVRGGTASGPRGSARAASCPARRNPGRARRAWPGARGCRRRRSSRLSGDHRGYLPHSRASRPAMSARSAFLSILPTLVAGSSGTMTSRSGHLKRAAWAAAIAERTASSVRLAPGARTA